MNCRKNEGGHKKRNGLCVSVETQTAIECKKGRIHDWIERATLAFQMKTHTVLDLLEIRSACESCGMDKLVKRVDENPRRMNYALMKKSVVNIEIETKTDNVTAIMDSASYEVTAIISGSKNGCDRDYKLRRR